MKTTIKNLLALHFLFLLFSLGGVFSKLASREELFSRSFLLFYCSMLFVMILYAIGWQQIIKKFSLTTAYANKAVNLIWGIIWGTIFFDEIVSYRMIIGALVVIIGIIIVVQSDE